MTAQATAPRYWNSERDDYGRPVKWLREGTRTLGAVVTLPKRTRHLLPGAYLVNNWTHEDRTDRDACVTYHDTLPAAKAHLERVAR